MFPCVAILGPRQCGKTTFLGELPDGWRVVDLERDSDAAELADPELFLRLNPARVAIDEAQLQPSLFRALRVAIDADRGRPGRFVITGSSSPSLVREISETLAGRAAVIEMAPLSLAEATGQPLSPLFVALRERWSPDALADALVVRTPTADVHRWWHLGGYPEPWTRADLRFHTLWMDAYVRTYVERDVGRLFPGLNRERFHTFVRMLAGLSGTTVNASAVARSLGVSQPTVRDYLRIAHGTFLWRTVPAFARNPTKRVVKAPKGYLRDSGLLHHLLRIPDVAALRAHPSLGASWEGAVVEELHRGLAMTGEPFDAFHYRTAGGAEVDLVLEGAFGLIPVVVKAGGVVRRRGLRAIRDFVAEHDCPYGLVISHDHAVRRLDERLLGVPAGCL